MSLMRKKYISLETSRQIDQRTAVPIAFYLINNLRSKIYFSLYRFWFSGTDACVVFFLSQKSVHLGK